MKLGIIGSAGVQGGAVLREAVVVGGLEVRAIALENELDGLRESYGSDGVEFAAGDLSKPETLADAINGLDVVYAQIPLVNDEEVGRQFGRALVEALEQAGSPHLIFNTSGIIPAEVSDVPAYEIRRYVADLAEERLPNTTVISPRIYLEVLRDMLAEPIQNGVLPFPLPADHKCSWVSVDQMAQFAVGLAKKGPEGNRRYDLGSGSAVSGTELAAALSAASPREVAYMPLELDVYEQNLAAAYGPDAARIIAKSFRWCWATGPNALVAETTAVEAATALQAEQVGDWAQRQAWLGGAQ